MRSQWRGREGLKWTDPWLANHINLVDKTPPLTFKTHGLNPFCIVRVFTCIRWLCLHNDTKQWCDINNRIWNAQKTPCNFFFLSFLGPPFQPTCTYSLHGLKKCWFIIITCCFIKFRYIMCIRETSKIGIPCAWASCFSFQHFVIFLGPPGTTAPSCVNACYFWTVSLNATMLLFQWREQAEVFDG